MNWWSPRTFDLLRNIFFQWLVNQPSVREISTLIVWSMEVLAGQKQISFWTHLFPYRKIWFLWFLVKVLNASVFGLLALKHDVLIQPMYGNEHRESIHEEAHRSKLQKPRYQFLDHICCGWDLRGTYRLENQCLYLWSFPWIIKENTWWIWQTQNQQSSHGHYGEKHWLLLNLDEWHFFELSTKDLKKYLW